MHAPKAQLQSPPPIRPNKVGAGHDHVHRRADPGASAMAAMASSEIGASSVGTGSPAAPSNAYPYRDEGGTVAKARSESAARASTMYETGFTRGSVIGELLLHRTTAPYAYAAAPALRFGMPKRSKCRPARFDTVGDAPRLSTFSIRFTTNLAVASVRVPQPRSPGSPQPTPDPTNTTTDAATASVAALQVPSCLRFVIPGW